MTSETPEEENGKHLHSYVFPDPDTEGLEPEMIKCGRLFMCICGKFKCQNCKKEFFKL